MYIYKNTQVEELASMVQEQQRYCAAVAKWQSLQRATGGQEQIAIFLMFSKELEVNKGRDHCWDCVFFSQV